MTNCIISSNWVSSQYGPSNCFCNSRTEAMLIKTATELKILKITQCALICDNFIQRELQNLEY
jgi:hypothetical protein